MNTKLDLINGAYSRMRISGITKIPSGSEVSKALDRLENMAATWFSLNIDTGYNFEDTPDSGSLHNLPRQHKNAYESNLAMLLLADFGKEVPPTLAAEAQGTYSTLYATAYTKTNQVQYPTRQPIGNANTLRRSRFQRYYTEVETPPNAATTNQLTEGDINDYVEHFDAFLKNLETISSYTIAADSTGISVSNDSLSSPDISYRVEAVEAGVHQVKIVATTSLGRVTTRKIIFNVEEA